jgi:glucan phosphoethanolaminetransferase (alkaline phosphatase superfamily)
MSLPAPVHRKYVRFLVAAGFAAAAGLISVPLIPAPFDTPSSGSSTAPQLVVLITIDALRADHLGVYGYGRPTSPVIDALARESVVIEDAIAQAPYTKRRSPR